MNTAMTEEDWKKLKSIRWRLDCGHLAYDADGELVQTAKGYETDQRIMKAKTSQYTTDAIRQQWPIWR